MPNLFEKSSTSFTFARWPQQYRSALTPWTKLASFIFLGLNSWSKKAHPWWLRVAGRKRRGRTVGEIVHQPISMLDFI
jgi:hypothetical protein